jgi:hypothetical protein
MTIAKFYIASNVKNRYHSTYRHCDGRMTINNFLEWCRFERIKKWHHVEVKLRGKDEIIYNTKEADND